MTAILLIGFFLLVLAVGMAIVDWRMGPDPDLERDPDDIRKWSS